MQCTRCEGLMVTDHLLDMQESYGPMWMRGWRCVSCGNVVDPLIQRNRMRQNSLGARAPVASIEAQPSGLDKLIA